MNDDWVIVRTQSAGCFAGKLLNQDGQYVTLSEARRLWYWAGAASLSELASRGTSKPTECKFPAPVRQVVLPETIEILTMNDEAIKNLQAVPIWSA
jgi:hypothetical protein